MPTTSSRTGRPRRPGAKSETVRRQTPRFLQREAKGEPNATAKPRRKTGGLGGTLLLSGGTKRPRARSQRGQVYQPRHAADGRARPFLARSLARLPPSPSLGKRKRRKPGSDVQGLQVSLFSLFFFGFSSIFELEGRREGTSALWGIVS